MRLLGRNRVARRRFEAGRIRFSQAELHQFRDSPAVLGVVIHLAHRQADSVHVRLPGFPCTHQRLTVADCAGDGGLRYPAAMRLESLDCLGTEMLYRGVGVDVHECVSRHRGDCCAKPGRGANHLAGFAARLTIDSRTDGDASRR